MAWKYFQKTIDEDPGADISNTSRKFQKIIAYRNKKEKPWSLEANAGFEYNDNVISSEEDLVTGNGDTALILEFEGGFKFLDFKNFEAEVSYDFFQLLYQDDLTAFDFQSHSPAISISGKFDKVTTDLSYRYTRTTLGEVDFMQINTISPSVGISWTPSLYTYLSYMYMDKEFQEAVSIDVVNREVTFADGRLEKYEQLVSTLPLVVLADLVDLVGDGGRDHTANESRRQSLYGNFWHTCYACQVFLNSAHFPSKQIE